jgi:uncharacterized protein (TIGR04255 family)
LKHDAIVEAIFEIRFDMTSIPELLFGRLADHPSWKNFERRRLPAYDIPAPMRQLDDNLRYQPVFELADVPNKKSIRVGPQALSYHQLAPYGSWAQFEPCLVEVVDQLFAKLDGVVIRRLGLRYLNALRSDLHGIRGLADLDLSVVVSEEQISRSLNLNYTVTTSDEIGCTVRVATVDLVQGPLPGNSSVFVDVDIFTKESFHSTDATEVKRWLKLAHDKEKENFFSLLRESTIRALEAT